MARVLHSLIATPKWEDADVKQLIEKVLPKAVRNPFLNFLYAELWQWLPIVPSSSGLQQLECILRWEGNLSGQGKQDIFQAFEQMAIHGDKKIQRDAMQSLAKLVHSYHVCDLQKIQKSGGERVQGYLQIKHRAIQILQELSHFEIPDTNSKRKRAYFYFKQCARVAYANYLLWWLGQSKNLSHSLIFSSIKIGKLTAEVFLLINLINTLKEALACPKQPGFQLA